jgi:hypothetical protein
MKSNRLTEVALAALVITGAVGGTQSAVRADTASTAAIAAGAAAIVGAILYDGNNRPYYVRDHHRYYVTRAEEGYYRGHHPGTERRAYVPEREYPVARDPYHGNNHGGNHRNDHGGGRPPHGR